MMLKEKFMELVTAEHSSRFAEKSAAVYDWAFLEAAAAVLGNTEASAFGSFASLVGGEMGEKLWGVEHENFESRAYYGSWKNGNEVIFAYDRRHLFIGFPCDGVSVQIR